MNKQGMRLFYETKLTVLVSDDGWATLNDFDMRKRCENIEEVVQGPLGDALIEAIIRSLGNPDIFDVTLS